MIFMSYAESSQVCKFIKQLLVTIKICYSAGRFQAAAATHFVL